MTLQRAVDCTHKEAVDFATTVDREVNHLDSYMSLVRKLVFGVSDQVPYKPGCTATEDG